MICPKCGYLLKKAKVSDKSLNKARKLRAKGYSFRDIQSVLQQEGEGVSFGYLAYIFRNKKRGLAKRIRALTMDEKK